MKNIPQKLYDKILETMPISCVDVVIVSDGKFLVVKRKDEPAKGEWWLPGGRVIKGETLKGCAHRKALEEVGLDCWVGPIVHTDETVFETGPNGIPVHSINVCFLLHPKDDSFIKLDGHSFGFKWDDLKETLYHPYVMKCLRGTGFDYD